MIEAAIPENEQERISALYEYDLLDTITESDYDNITRIASEICHVPISLISLIDNERQFLKSRTGLSISETPRSVSFCSHAILSPGEIFEVPNTAVDERFHDNPLVTGDPNISFYAGVPLVNEMGFALGTLCVIDNKPKQLTQAEKGTLNALAKQIVAYFELRKKNIELVKQKLELETINKELERFAYVAAHDLKSPCSNLIMLSGILKEDYAEKLDQQGLWMLDSMQGASQSLSRLVDGILLHSRTIQTVSQTDKTKFLFGDIAQELKQAIGIPRHIYFTCDNESLELFTSRPSLFQILLNLCVNSVKYNDKPDGILHLSLEDKGDYYHFGVTDNGIGISAEQHDKIFELFTSIGLDHEGNKGNGIGLSTVKRLVEKQGRIYVESEPGKGSSFYFTVKK